MCYYTAALGVPLVGDRLPMRVWLSMMPVSQKSVPRTFTIYYIKPV